MDIKELVEKSGVDRREIAKHLGITPSTLNGKLTEWNTFRPEEEEKIRDFIRAQTADNA